MLTSHPWPPADAPSPKPLGNSAAPTCGTVPTRNVAAIVRRWGHTVGQRRQTSHLPGGGMAQELAPPQPLALHSPGPPPPSLEKAQPLLNLQAEFWQVTPLQLQQPWPPPPKERCQASGLPAQPCQASLPTEQFSILPASGQALPPPLAQHPQQAGAGAQAPKPSPPGFEPVPATTLLPWPSPPPGPSGQGSSRQPPPPPPAPPPPPLITGWDWAQPPPPPPPGALSWDWARPKPLPFQQPAHTPNGAGDPVLNVLLLEKRCWTTQRDVVVATKSQLTGRALQHRCYARPVFQQ